MTIRLEDVSITIINIYNLIGNKKVIIIGMFMELSLDKAKKEIILLKDFNSYHFMWGGRAVVIEI